jgi:ribosomal protein S12 methylthiotransferase
MLAQGISEIEIICQDTTRYGTDLYEEPRLLELLEAIEAIPGNFRFRLFYLYPDTLTFAHLERLAKLKKLLPYFDIPFQHYSASVLKRMGRFYDQAHISRLLAFIRENFAGSFIRTSFIVGFPGETDADFEELVAFVKQEKFESVGVFQYHDEPLAASSKLDNKVSDEVVKVRMKVLSTALDEIYSSHAAAAKGQVFDGYVMQMEDDTVIVRREIQAPEIDEYDEISYDNLIAGPEELDLGSFVQYRI